MAHDVKFVVNSGDYKGDEYGYTLAMVDGKKAWQRAPLFYPPPSMIKEKIDMVIDANEYSIPNSGAVELENVNKILEQLTIIATETTPSTLTGIDNEEKLVLIDQNGFSVTSVVNETNKEPEYQVNLTCWVLYDY